MKTLLLLLTFLTWPARADDPWREIWGWGQDPLHDKYEERFDKPFQPLPYDVFHRMHPFYEVQAFNREFDRRAAGVTTRVEGGPSGVNLLVVWPGSGAQAVDVKVERGLVRFASQPPPAASPYHFRAGRAQALDVPVPPGADPKTAHVTRDGDVIRVAFSRG